jgi:hypothetical protein
MFGQCERFGVVVLGVVVDGVVVPGVVVVVPPPDAAHAPPPAARAAAAATGAIQRFATIGSTSFRLLEVDRTGGG